MAPEIIRENPSFQGITADIYRLGVILFEFFAGCPPF
jgi:hypothetical protein